MTEPRVIFTADPGERIVSTVVYRGRLFVATEYRILEWDADQETWSVLEFITLKPELEKQVVIAAERWPR